MNCWVPMISLIRLVDDAVSRLGGAFDEEMLRRQHSTNQAILINSIWSSGLSHLESG